jgi:hypothetical protein
MRKYLLTIIFLLCVSTFATTKLFANSKLYLDSPELSNLKKIKNIKNKAGKPNKDGVVYVGQKGLLLQNGYGIMEFQEGGLFIGYFHKGALRDGTWVIKDDVSTDKYEYIENNILKKDSNGKPIVKKSEWRDAKEFEIDYLKENIFLENKITYEEYLKITGKDKLLAKKNNDKQIKKENKEVITATGFNSFSGELEDKTPYIIDAYYKDDCIKYGLVRYLNNNKDKTKQEVFGTFENCQVFDSNSKFTNVFFDEDGKVKEINLHKKDVSHIYGVRLMIGIETKDIPNKKGVQIVSFQKDLPAIESDLEEKDIIIKVNNVSADNAFRFVQLIKEAKPNEKIKIDYVSHKNLNDNFDYTNSDIRSLEIIPKLVSSKMELRIAYLVNEKEYVEYLVDHEQSFQSDLHDLIKYEKGTTEWNERQKVLQKDFFLLEDYYNLIKKIALNKDKEKNFPLFDFSQVYVVSNKPVGNKIAKNEFKPDQLNDVEAPAINVVNNFTFDKSNYTINGKVTDNTEGPIYIEIDGILSLAKNGSFQINRFSPVSEKIEIVAIDQWGNRSQPSIIDITINKISTQQVKKLERLNPLKYTNKENQDSVALIIGIEDYSKNPKASFANLDAKFFFEYAKNSFGIKEENIKLMVNQEANLIDLLSALNKWLPSKIIKDKTQLYIYFAGHGLASNDGKELYLLPQDGDSDLLFRTGISRTELFNIINKFSPKNTIMFLDTCYSGVSRDDKTLLASARPIRLVADDQKNIPDNITIFSASQLNQISSGLNEAKHGIFSYYLMKGLEGNADLNKDKNITNGELLAYMDLNVSQKASELGRQQNPTLSGKPDDILINY